MSWYIEGPDRDKGEFLINEHGAIPIDTPTSFEDKPHGKALICIIDNGYFEAAAYCCDDRDFGRFTYPDPRPKRWYVMDKDVAEELSGFAK